MPSEEWVEITYPFPNFNGCTGWFNPPWPSDAIWRELYQHCFGWWICTYLAEPLCDEQTKNYIWMATPMDPVLLLYFIQIALKFIPDVPVDNEVGIGKTLVTIILWCPTTKMLIKACFLIQPLEQEGGCQRCCISLCSKVFINHFYQMKARSEYLNILIYWSKYWVDILRRTLRRKV